MYMERDDIDDDDELCRCLAGMLDAMRGRLGAGSPVLRTKLDELYDLLADNESRRPSLLNPRPRDQDRDRNPPTAGTCTDKDRTKSDKCQTKSDKHQTNGSWTIG